jgi:hypothetical protein
MNFFRKLAHQLRFLLWGSLLWALYSGVYKPLKAAQWQSSGGLSGEDLRGLERGCSVIYRLRGSLGREPSALEAQTEAMTDVSPAGRALARYEGGPQAFVSTANPALILQKCP